jgi:long-chain fatty acid transport protein
MRKVLGSIALAVAVAASPAWATNGIRMIGFGPVQNSMGGVSVGASLDAAAVLTNPAGIADMGGRFDFGATYFGADVKYTATDGVDCGSVPPPGGCLIVNDDVEYTSDRGPSPVPAFGLVIPINEDWNFGLGAYGIAGLGTDWASNVALNTVYSHYSQMRFAPGLSYKINEMFAVGATVNLMYANLGYAIGVGPFAQTAHNDASAFGLGATVSATVKPIKGLTVAVAYESQGSYPTFKYNTPAVDANGDGVPDFPASVEELEFNSPQTVTGGIGYQFGPVLVAADVQWINWSGVLGDDLPEYKEAKPTTLPFDLEWEDQIVYKFGLQWDAVPNVFSVRLGYNYGALPLNEDKALQNIAFPAVAEQHITGGVSWFISPKVGLHLGGMYSPEAKVSGTQDLSDIGYPLPVTYEAKMSQYALDAGLTYRF